MQPRLLDIKELYTGNKTKVSLDPSLELNKKDNHPFNYGLHYSKWHNDSKEHQIKMINMYENMIKHQLPKDKKSRILDIGCGMGFLMLTLKKLGYQNVKGIEISKEQADSCLRKNLDVTLTDDSISTLTANQEWFDIIFCMDVLEHIPINQQIPFVSAIFAALKPGGKFVCTVPNANSTLASRWRYIDWTHVTSFTEHSIDFLLKNTGFEKTDIRPSDPFVEEKTLLQKVILKFTRWFRRMEMIAELGEEGKDIPLSVNLLVTGYKET